MVLGIILVSGGTIMFFRWVSRRFTVNMRLFSLKICSRGREIVGGGRSFFLLVGFVFVILEVLSF